MADKMKNWWTGAAALALAALVVGGCHHEKADEADAGDTFLEKDEVSDVVRLMDQHVAAGARTDATLRPYHFNHGVLNSLGRQKLDLMLGGLDGESDGELVVYLDVPGGKDTTAPEYPLAAARQDAVTDYLMSKGLTEDMFHLESGPNPDNTFIAANAAPKADGAAPAAPAPAAPAGGLMAGGTGMGGGTK